MSSTGEASDSGNSGSSAKKMDMTVPGAGWTNSSSLLLYPQTRDGRIAKYDAHRRWIGLAAGWSRIGAGSTELDARVSSSQIIGAGRSHLLSPEDESRRVRALLAQLCEVFFRAGWNPGTSGGVSIRTGGPAENRPWRVFVAPSGIQKEDMIGEDVFELDMNGDIVTSTITPGLRLSACTPLWFVVYKLRPSATCVIHTHSINAVMATLLDPTEKSKVLTLTHLEMLKGVGNHAYNDVLHIPIIDNRPSEDLLSDQLEAAIKAYPKCNAVLVRRHGLFVWGDSWEQAKTQCESFDYLFQCAVTMQRQLQIDPARIPASGTFTVDTTTTTAAAAVVREPPAKKPRMGGEDSGFRGWARLENADECRSNTVPILPRDTDRVKALLLDIEGCTSSIAFVKETLFPFVRERLNDYLQQHNYTDKTSAKFRELSKGLYEEVQQHAAKTKDDDDSVRDLKEEGVEKLVLYLMDHDVKSKTLKDLQGEMWKDGYESGQLRGHVYEDTVHMLKWMKQHDVPVYIYSSGSIAAQKLLFGYSVAGDLLPYVAGHFDITTAGNKKEATSYSSIADQLNIPVSEIMFISDSEAELNAASAAGMIHTIMSIRPGNAPLSSKEYIRSNPVVYSLLQVCGKD